MARDPKYDPQRSKLYRMEKRGLPGLARAKFSAMENRSLLRNLCKQFDVDVPRLRRVKSQGWSGMYMPEPEPVIYQSTTSACGTGPMTLLHELAHHIVFRWDDNDYLAPHGPEFVGVYGDLLGMVGFLPYASWPLLCEQYGVAYLDTTRMRSIDALRRAVKKRAAEAARKSPRTKTV